MWPSVYIAVKPYSEYPQQDFCRAIKLPIYWIGIFFTVFSVLLSGKYFCRRQIMEDSQW